MKRTSILSMLLSIAVILTLVSCGGSSGRTPKSMTKKTMSYLEKGDFENAVRYMMENAYPKEEINNFTEKEMAEFESGVTLFTGKVKASVQKMGGIKKIEILDEVISEDGDSAEVNTRIHYGDGTVKDDSEKFKKIDGVWYYKM